MINILLVVVILALIYRVINVKTPGPVNAKKNNFFDIIINLIFYIPCLFSGSFDFMVGFFTNEYKSTTVSSILLLVLYGLFVDKTFIVNYSKIAGIACAVAAIYLLK